VKAAPVGAGQITGQHFSCLKALAGVQNARSGILVKEGRFDADDAQQCIARGSSR
jgi:hypothetical protein